MKRAQADMPRVKRSIFISILLMLWWTAFSAWASDTKNLLVLHSYHQGLAWTDAITRGIETRIKSSGIAVNIEYAYMDTKRVCSRAYLDQLASMYAVKYAHHRFDAIIASDDHAFNFLRRHHQALFDHTPVVFCGLNNFEDAMLADRPHFTGVLESFDILATINLALDLQPRAKRLVVIGDQTVSGQANHKRFQQIIPRIKRPVPIVCINDHTMAEVLAEVARLDPRDIVIWLVFTTDREGRYFSFQESTRMISRHSKAPVYSFWDFNLNHGIVGGLLTSGGMQGEHAADLALQILAGKPASELPVVRKSPNTYMFDYHQLKRFDLKLADLPAGSRIINRPQTRFSRHKTIIITALVIFMTMSTIIVLLLLAMAARKKAVRALVASKNRYQNVFNSTSVAFFEVDLSAVQIFLDQHGAAGDRDLHQHLNDHPHILAELAGRLKVKDVNPAAISLFKAPDKKGLIRSLSQLIPPDGAHIFKAIIVALAGRVPHFIRETATRTITGETLHVILGLNLINAGQNYQNVIASVFDITDRKFSEEALSRSKDRFRTVFNRAASGMALIDLNGNYLRVNKALNQMLGYTEQELLHRTWKEITHPDDVKPSLALLKQVLDGYITNPIEKRYLHKDGREVQTLFNLAAIFSETHQPIYLIAQFQDITPIKAVQAALKEKEKRYRRFFEADLSGVYAVSPQGEVIMCNEVFAKILGFDKSADIIGTNISDYYKDPTLKTPFLERITRAQHVDQLEITLVRRDGVEIQCLVNAIGQADEQGRLTEIQGYLLDITRMKSLENQLLHAQKMESIGTMAGGVAHDFNNLLMGIMGNVSLMLTEKAQSDPDYQRLLNIEQLIQSGSDLTRQLLGFAKGSKYEVRPTDLNLLIHSSAKMFARTHKEIEVETQLAENLWLVEADRTQIDQVLYNLYLNAWQAMNNSGHLKIGTRNCTLTRREASPYGLRTGKFIAVTVTDDGMGMDAATQQQIFDPFFTTKERELGTGLGLASVYSIIKNHAGRISVESEPGQGATFSILLPASGKRRRAESPKAVPKLIGGTETILLVDDEPGILDAVGNMLNHLGYQVIKARGGQAAIQAFDASQEKIDLVILDMVMPGISGSKVFKRCKEINPHARILLSSGYSVDGQAAEIIDQGCEGFIQKPFTISQLSHTLGRIFKKNR